MELLLGSLVDKFFLDENGEKIAMENPITLEDKINMLKEEMTEFEVNLVSSHNDVKQLASKVEKVSKMSTKEFEQYVNPEI